MEEILPLLFLNIVWVPRLTVYIAQQNKTKKTIQQTTKTAKMCNHGRKHSDFTIMMKERASESATITNEKEEPETGEPDNVQL